MVLVTVAHESWRVQWYARNDVADNWRPMGRRDFDDELEAREYYDSPETTSRRIIEDIWRVELQQITVTTVVRDGTGYLNQRPT